MRPGGLLQPHDQICSTNGGGKRLGPPALLLHLNRCCRLWALCDDHHKTRVSCQTAEEASRCCQRYILFHFFYFIEMYCITASIHAYFILCVYTVVFPVFYLILLKVQQKCWHSFETGRKRGCVFFFSPEIKIIWSHLL